MENNKRFLVGGVERTVRNGRLNCNNIANIDKRDRLENGNGTYVKKIRRGKEVYPYASVQWQKRNIKEFAKLKGHKISSTRRDIGGKAGISEGNPYLNFDEDIMGFMNASKEVLSENDYNKLTNLEKTGFKKEIKGKNREVIYSKNITKKRRAKLMCSALQAIGDTQIINEFGTMGIDNDDAILYNKEVYSTEMASGFVLDITEAGSFKVSDNEKQYRDYAEIELEGIKDVCLDENNTFKLDFDEKYSRVTTVLEALYHMNTNITYSNNLEDLTANFIILADYSLGNAIFNNIFKNNMLDISLLKSRIEGMEKYRLSKIYIGCIDNLVLSGENVKDRLELEFGKDDRFVMGSVEYVLKEYKDQLKSVI